MDRITRKIATTIGAIVMLCALIMIGGLLVGFPIKWLWNWLLPDMFGLKVIGFWQAWGFAVLCGMLFKSSASNKSDD
jgi:hypothetical protein